MSIQTELQEQTRTRRFFAMAIGILWAHAGGVLAGLGLSQYGVEPQFSWYVTAGAGMMLVIVGLVFSRLHAPRLWRYA